MLVVKFLVCFVLILLILEKEKLYFHKNKVIDKPNIDTKLI